MSAASRIHPAACSFAAKPVTDMGEVAHVIVVPWCCLHRKIVEFGNRLWTCVQLDLVHPARRVLRCRKAESVLRADWRSRRPPESVLGLHRCRILDPPKPIATCRHKDRECRSSTVMSWVRTKFSARSFSCCSGSVLLLSPTCRIGTLEAVY